MNRKALESVLLFAYEGMRARWRFYPNIAAFHNEEPFPQGLLPRIQITVRSMTDCADEETSSTATNWCRIYREWEREK